jgi:ABC-type transport system substrate-binding protein
VRAAKVRTFCYQSLYYRDPVTLKLVPWLAAGDPVWDAENKTVTIPLREAKWEDGTPFTADDVIFTIDTIRRFRLPKHWSKWFFVSEAEAVDPHTVKLTLLKPMAIFWERTLQSFVVKKKAWEPVVEKAAKALEKGMTAQKAAGKKGKTALRAALRKPLEIMTTYPNTSPSSLGPFTFERWQKGAFIHLAKNKNFFALNGSIAGKPTGPHVDGILFKIYGNMDTAVLALKKGDIDYFWAPIESGYLEDLREDDRIKIFSVLKSGYKYMAFNLRRPPMKDRAFRLATAYLVDKDFIVNRILHREGGRFDTLVPPDSLRYHNPNTPKYGEGLTWKERVAKAAAILKEAGYVWDTEPVGGNMAGQYVTQGKGLKLPDGNPTPSLHLLTPPADYDAQRAQAGNLIQQWLHGFGVPVDWRPMSFGAMIKKVRSEQDFDMFVSGWRTGIDPDHLRSFFHSSGDRPKGRNSGGYRNDKFDRLAELQAATMDLNERAIIVRQCQDILMHDLPYLPLYVQLNLEGVRIDRYDGWVQMVGGIGNMWSFLQVKPVKK